jgi:ABC-2 type transport system ATP-binding protein
MDDRILKVNGLVKKYERFSLKEVSIEIPRGYIMGFVGRNGAGKSTTIKCVMSLIPFDKGSIEVFGLDSGRFADEIKNRVGYVSEEHYFYEGMDVTWTGGFFGSFYPKWDSVYFDKLLKKFDVDPKKKVGELSKGMKMKLSLALALGHHPELLILDEPTSGLDPVVRSELLDLFLEIVQDENCSIFFSSHITSDIEKVADFVTVINDGRVILSGEKDSILRSWKVFKIENGCFTEEICRNLIGVRKGEFGFSGISDRPDRFVKEFRRLFPEGRFNTENITLDELLVRLVKESEAGC